MLVLTRKVGESILVGDEIEITLVRIEDDQVRIGISAPKNVAVYRKELVEEIGQENIRAAEMLKSEGEDVLDVVKKLKSTQKQSSPKSKNNQSKAENMEEEK